MRFSLLIILASFVFLGCQSVGTTMNKKERPDRGGVKSVAKPVAEKNTVIAQKSIYEELTGKKGLTRKQASTKILEMARDAKWKRDYVTALKRYNTLIVKYPKSSEVRQAYLDKAALYKEMGLIPQSKYNLEKARK